MIHKRVLTFFAAFSLFGALIALIHLFLLLSLSFGAPLTGYSILDEPSPPLLGAVAFLLLVLAFLFLILATKRFIPTTTLRRIALTNVVRSPQPPSDIFK